MPVRDIDHGWRAMDQRLEAFARGNVLVGIQGAEADESHGKGGLTTADVAAFNEFGLGVPERSFLRATIDENEAQLLQLQATVGRGVALGTFSAEQGLGLIGEHAVGLIQDRISNGIPPSNAPATIARKGSSTPLIHEGQMRRSITAKPVIG